MATNPGRILDEGPAQSAQAERWERFALRNDIECPGCGYSLRGLPNDRCPECGVRIDTATIMYCSEPLELASFGRSARWFWSVVLLNITLLAVSHASLAPARAWSSAAAPPAGWYGAITLGILWFAAMLVSIALWHIQLAQERSGRRHDVPMVDSALRTAHFIALAGTALHAAWITLQLFST